MNIQVWSKYQLKEHEKQLESQLADVKSELKSRKEAEEQLRREELIPDWQQQVRDSYLEGFECGVDWNDDYVPGGPFVSGHPKGWSLNWSSFVNTPENERLMAKYLLSKARYNAWHDGWKIGMKKQKELKNGN